VLGPRRRLVHEVVPVGSFTDPEYGSVGLTEEQARARYDCAVAVARYDELLRPVADGQPEGFCKLGVHPMPQLWSSLRAPPLPDGPR
jgi:pyruvate/2-oxoglutarate dehydrogenase complex dihydrolipoamide dehydrogenase (E3) component